MLAIITPDLYIFYSIFHFGLYCRALSVTDNLSSKQGNSVIFGSKMVVKRHFKGLRFSWISGSTVDALRLPRRNRQTDSLPQCTAANAASSQKTPVEKGN